MEFLLVHMTQLGQKRRFNKPSAGFHARVVLTMYIYYHLNFEYFDQHGALWFPLSDPVPTYSSITPISCKYHSPFCINKLNMSYIHPTNKIVT